MELTKEQQEQWLTEYTKYAVMTKLVDDCNEENYYKLVDFDAYAAYEYLNKVCDFESYYYSWVIGDMKVIIDIESDDKPISSKDDLAARKEYLKNKVKIPRGLNKDEKTFIGLMYLAKVLGCNPGIDNWNDMGEDVEIFRDSLLVGRFPINAKKKMIVMKIDAQYDDSSNGVRILY